MRHAASTALLLLIMVLAQGCSQQVDYPQPNLDYPVAQKGDVVDVYHGVSVADPYRWLEDPDSPESRAWIEAENEITFAYLEDIPARDKIRRRLEKLWDFDKYGLPSRKGDRFFMSKQTGLQNQPVLYTMKSLDDEPRVLLDPNTLSEDGTVALSGMAASEDGNYLAYSLSAAGSDWQKWRVRNVETGEDLDEVLEWVKFSGAAWTHDNKGFFYSRYDEPASGAELQAQNLNQKLFYHRVGTPQSEDKLVFAAPEHPDWFVGGSVTDDGRYLILNIGKGDDHNTLIYYQDLSQPDSPVVQLIDRWIGEFTLVGNDGPVFWLHTNYQAPRYRVVAIDTRNPVEPAWREVIPQQDETLRAASVLNHQLVARYLKDAYTQVRILEPDGSFVREIELPTLGTAGGFPGDPDDTETFYSFTSFSYPTTIYRYDMKSGKSEVFRRPKVDFNPDNYVTRQVFYESKDGTRVPMFITHKKGVKLDGTNPTYLYGYGGFNISLTPYFSVTRLVWMEMGGVYAVANLRGGGEYGQDWHEAGTRLTKQNVFDDFIAGAEWLIDNNYTNSDRLAIGGGSNGGLLVGACMLQRPDLFGAALPAVGVMDMLRFQKFTIGWAWVSDYGSSEDPEEFKALYAYSPLHNIKPGTEYPATFITTADHDDRVVPAHSFKFAAALQAAQGGDEPILIRIETQAGHGGGKPTAKIIEEQADCWAFLVRQFKMPV